MLDAVAPGAAPRRGVGVEHLADRPVADRVGSDVEPGVVELLDRAAEVLGVGRHRVVAVATGVGLLEPAVPVS